MFFFKPQSLILWIFFISEDEYSIAKSIISLFFTKIDIELGFLYESST